MSVSLKSLADFEGVSPKSFDKVIDTCPNPPTNPEHLKNWDNHNHKSIVPVLININLRDNSGNYTSPGIVRNTYGIQLLCEGQLVFDSGIKYGNSSSLIYTGSDAWEIDPEFVDILKPFTLKLTIDLMLQSVSGNSTSITLSATLGMSVFMSKMFSITQTQHLVQTFEFIGAKDTQLSTTSINRVSFTGTII